MNSTTTLSGSIASVSIGNNSISKLISNGDYNWTVGCSDSSISYNQNSTDLFELFVQIDNENPSINFTSPSDDSGITVARNYIVVNVTANDSNFVNLTVNLYNNAGSLLNSTTSVYDNLYLIYTSLSNARYFVNATAMDFLGNSNSTETRNITVNVESQVCGNSVVETGEQCDDGNIVNGDGCDSSCQTESSGGGGGCTVSSWTCEDWDSVQCVNGEQERQCTSNCNTKKNETQSCGACTIVSCDSWSQCINGEQERECLDSCGNDIPETRICGSECIPDWQCSDFGVCYNSIITRECQDLNSCGDDFLKPEESLKCFKEGCTINKTCFGWGECTYTKKVEDILKGVVRTYGLRERICDDTNQCAATPKEYQFCRDIVNVTLIEEDICGEKTLTAVNTDTGKPVTNINLDSWKEERLDIKFVQNSLEQCTNCNDAVQDGDETGVDCGGLFCSECKGLSIWRIIILILLFLIFLLLLLILFFLLRRRRNKVQQVRDYIKKGNLALASHDYLRAKALYELIRAVYDKMNDRETEIVSREIREYYKKLSKVWESSGMKQII